MELIFNMFVSNFFHCQPIVISVLYVRHHQYNIPNVIHQSSHPFYSECKIIVVGDAYSLDSAFLVSGLEGKEFKSGGKQ